MSGEAPIQGGAGGSRLSPLISLLRCLECGAPVAVSELAENPGYPELGPDGRLACTECGEQYPLIGGTARMLDRGLRRQLVTDYPRARLVMPETEGAAQADPERNLKRRTADSFAYEWRHFGHWRSAWEKNFLDYMRPHGPESFRDRLMLDVGAGSGRHSFQAAQFGGRVVAVDIGRSIDVARRNLPPDVLTVQADAERLPFASGTFDFVLSLGVLHHLPDPERALRSIVELVRPEGTVHVYLYWRPPYPSHRAALRLVSAARHATVRMPHALLHFLCYPLAAALYAACVVPYRLLRHWPAAAWFADRIPLKAYADYPFGVLVNDQFDRFSAPLEQRYTESQVRNMLLRTGLTAVTVLPNTGWVGDGRMPSERDG
jgi:SAM-dependent methyltransferase/uncharacterized protein YbaR (Trm112 family)